MMTQTCLSRRSSGDVQFMLPAAAFAAAGDMALNLPLGWLTYYPLTFARDGLLRPPCRETRWWGQRGFSGGSILMVSSSRLVRWMT
jgi:hypothetical protein